MTAQPRLRYFGAKLDFAVTGEMVNCAVKCSWPSDRDKDVSGYRIPTILTGRGERELELRIIAGFLAAVSRANMTENMV